MARGQIVQLAVGDEFPVEAPERARLGVVDVHLPGGDVLGRTVQPVGQHSQEMLLGRQGALQRGQQQRKFALFVEFQAFLVHLAIHVDGQVG